MSHEDSSPNKVKVVSTAAAFGKRSIQSNRESGYARCDVAMIPKDPNKHNAMVMEFKRTEDEAELTQIAELALKQISQNDYAAVFAQHLVKTITAVGIGFAGKRVQVVTKQLIIHN